MLGDDDRLSRRVIVDVEGYRARREVHAAELAQRAAERVKSSGQRQMLDPMGGYERRAIHMALQGDPDVRTESMGKEPARRVVIHPRGPGGQPTG
jgi:spoIIIJ-associated protein